MSVRSKRSSYKGRIVLWILLFLIGIGITGFITFYPAICFLKRFQESKELLFCTSHITRTDLQLPQIGTQALLFRPHGEATTTLIIVPGLHPFGIFDSRFQSFAESLADSGFVVVAPDIQEFREFQVTPDSVNLISSLVDLLPDLVPPGSLQNVGLLGISYGVGPAIVAASRKEVKNKIHFLASVGGYYNMLHAMEYSITGAYPGIHTLRPPDRWGRMIITLNHLQYMAPASDVPALEDSLSLRLNLKESKAKEIEENLTPDGKKFLNEVLNGFDPVKISHYKKVLNLDRVISRELSPQFVIKDLSPNLRLYLIHGSDDNSIPSSETEELYQALKRRKHRDVRLLITSSLTHVDPEKNDRWMDKIRLMLWTRALLNEAR